MKKIKWCFKQKKGIKIIEPNLKLSLDYIKRAKDDFKTLKNQNKVWQIIIAYYICYNSLYSVLIRCGIKSEIHSCSIYLITFLDNLKKYFDFLEELKELRTDVQYYLQEPKEINLNKVKEFIEICELELNEINSEKIKIFTKSIYEFQFI